MKTHAGALIAALVLGLATTAAEAAERQPHDCFPAGNAWQGWNSAGSGDVLYLRVHINDIYRVDLSPGSHAYKYPGYFLVNRVRGSGWICSALDLDLTMSSDYGFQQPLIAVSMRKLTPAEITAIPCKELP